MYARSYPREDEKIPLPSGYDGTAFEKEPIDESRECVVDEASSEKEGIITRIPFLKSLGLSDKMKLPFKLGTEELVLLGVALLLFFGKDGDKDVCCILLYARVLPILKGEPRLGD